MRWARLAVLSLLVLSSACAGAKTYVRSRVADLQDVVPWSISCGWGLGVSLQATPLLQVGLGLTPIHANRWGYDDRTVRGVWREAEILFPYTLWHDALDADLTAPDYEQTGFPWWNAPLVYRWQLFRDAPTGEGRRNQDYEPNMQGWGRHPPIVRESLGAFIAPATRRWLDFNEVRREQADPDVLNNLGPPRRASLWESRRAGRPANRAWDLFEADIFAGVIGVRLGVRPVEFVDFLLGIFLVDLLGDDLPVPVSVEPSEQPLPAAS